jgi:hypothetical protein
MKNKSVVVSLGLMAAVVAGLLATVGCLPAVFVNLTAERTGSVTFIFINDTPYRASFSFGTYDAWDRLPETVTELNQLRLEARTTSAPASVQCMRNAVIGTDEFVTRVLNSGGAESPTFDVDAFDAVVHFSSAAADAPDAALPTVGTALGVEKLLGIDYSCADQLIFTFVQDPDAEGGFRIDFAVLQEEEE